MFRKLELEKITLVILSLLLVGCSAPSLASSGELDGGISLLVDQLERDGAEVEFGEKISQPFFSPEGQILMVNGGAVQVFEYADQVRAKEDAEKISPDGSTVGTTMISWIDPPHFYHKGSIIVLYLGQDSEIMDLLEANLGLSIAG